MSPMIDIQRRHAEVFRIRLGDKGPNGFPQKLTDAIRVTSPNEGVCHAFTAVYGGEVQPWNGDGRKEFEAYLPTTSLAILVLPGQSLQQWWEKYKKSVCVTRCDGVTDTKTKKPCTCPADIEERMSDKKKWCAPMTRVNVLCPDVAVVGSGALVTHSLIAAETLPQSIAVAEAALSRGLMVPARLRVVEHKGLTHYIVPQIEIVGVSLSELVGAGEVAQLASVTDARSLSSVPSWKPVGELPPAPVMSVADQLAEVAVPQPKPQRRNTAQALPSTGLAPRTADEASAETAPMWTAAKAKTALVDACAGDKDRAAELWGGRGSAHISADDLNRLLVEAEIAEATVLCDECGAEISGRGDCECGPPEIDKDEGDSEPVQQPVPAEPSSDGAGVTGAATGAPTPPRQTWPNPAKTPMTASQRGMLHGLLGKAFVAPPEVSGSSDSKAEYLKTVLLEGLLPALGVHGMESRKQIDKTVGGKVIDALQRIEAGEIQLVAMPDGAQILIDDEGEVWAA